MYMNFYFLIYPIITLQIKNCIHIKDEKTGLCEQTSLFDSKTHVSLLHDCPSLGGSVPGENAQSI